MDDATTAAFAEEIGGSDAVAVAGSRTRWSAGGELEPHARTITAPTGILEYRPEEMTVGVRAGTTVRELHVRLAESGQRTALPERGGTVGGAIAVGENALDVQGRGLVRSAVLQVRYVSAEGRVITGGGPTVKNVTGFDLPRLMVGALGTLGLMAEVILRTNPIPAASVWLESSDVDPFVAHGMLRRPSAVLWDGLQTWIDLEGHAPDVEAQRRALDDVGSWSVTDGPPVLPPHRWSLPPAELRSFHGRAAGPFVASIGVGTVFASRPQPPKQVDAALRDLSARVKNGFDPTGRLNPGRTPGRR
ncbi:MAG: FAD-binding protein [Actinomycetota bacterium]|nr:FAD-binding protein [Actinomycetota bacterium]